MTDKLRIDALMLVVLAEPPEAAQVRREAAVLGLVILEEPPEYYQEELTHDLRYTGPFLICGD